MARLKLTLAYCGSAYAGWQIQAESQGTGTIQQELERALETIAGYPVRVHGAGRTDSGVHAEGQTAHADVPEKPVDWQRALNALLPRDIRVLAAEPVAAGFHARYDSIGKVYAYTLFSGAGPVPPRLEPFVWATPPLDGAAMEAAAAILTGRHDFASFQNMGTPVADTVREVWSIRREEGRAGPFCCPESWPVTTWFFHGNGFLKQMVRNMLGLMVWAGQGRVDAAGIAACLAAKTRRAVPSPTAPAKGLTLMRVDYPG
ncbi:tRNA pseudouridine synthase A [uncultured delta proteobacterium]|uniref:tRNA pseudouridine synthase A n=1 Tax=uncultured delta proteobacterium TaxID=34034 RepID=A0A212KHE3_9DELT|nr:tRNA pseudouridine synthase A [uncultured delta proteobacterium]